MKLAVKLAELAVKTAVKTPAEIGVRVPIEC